MDDDALQHWAMIEREIYDARMKAREEVWKKHGLSKQSYKQLMFNAFSLMTSDTVNTDYGIVQKRFNGKRVTYRSAMTKTQAENNQRSLILNIKESR